MIFLIRHTAPKIDKGICYGQADIDVLDSFAEEVALLKAHLPADISSVYSSPLLRCKKLAEYLFPAHGISWRDDLMEINCGEWELKAWNAIPKAETQPWMDDLINVRIPGGESYLDLHDRVVNAFRELQFADRPVAIVAHGGVFRSILAHLTNTPLHESFDKFGLHYGCVVKLMPTDNGFEHQLLTTNTHGKETHKPTY